MSTLPVSRRQSSGNAGPSGSPPAYTPPTRSRSNTALSHSLQLTSMAIAGSGGSGSGSSASTPRRIASRPPSRNSSPILAPSGQPSSAPGPLHTIPPPHSHRSLPPSPDNDATWNSTRWQQAPNSPPRQRSQSTAAISSSNSNLNTSSPYPTPSQLHTQQYASPPQPVFATAAAPGGYFAYPFFAAAPSQQPPDDGSGLRASYSSPHLPYMLAAAAQQRHHAQHQGMPPPYPFPYPFQMTPPSNQNVGISTPPPVPPQPSSSTPTRRRNTRDRMYNLEQERESSSESDGLAFVSETLRQRRAGRSRNNSDSGNHDGNAHDGHVDFADDHPRSRRPTRKRSAPAFDTETDDMSSQPPPIARRLTPSVPNFSFRDRHPYIVRMFPPIILLFRLLSIVPATLGSLSHILNLIDTSQHLPRNTRVDYFLSLLWAILTARQCLAFTNGLFLRWKAYYPLVPTLIRLLALQAICWPATHLTLTTFDHLQRPLICWTLIGTTTCVTRSIQIWATSNLLFTSPSQRRKYVSPANEDDSTLSPTSAGIAAEIRAERRRRLEVEEERGRTRAWMSSLSLGLGGHGGILGIGSGTGAGPVEVRKRTWDWQKVSLRCVLPAAVIYFLMAWSLLLKTEYEWAQAASAGASSLFSGDLSQSPSS